MPGKLNRTLSPARPTSVTSTVSQSPAAPDTVTANFGAGYTRDTKSELFLLAVTAMFGEDTFYEQAGKRDNRFVTLVHEVTRTDPDWVARFVPYLRDVVNIRTAAVVMAVEYARAVLAMQKSGDAADGMRLMAAPSIRSVVYGALRRADEPAEALAYAQSIWGRSVPIGVKRGIADAVRRLYTQRSALKYDGVASTIRMGDVVELAHPAPTDAEQGALFRYLIDARHNRSTPPRADGLALVAERKRLDAMPVAERKAWFESATPDDIAGALARAGATWEWLGGWLQGPMTAKAWEAVIPAMGYMALLRNLRNFDEAGVSDTVKAKVADTLSDAYEVVRSRQMPLRFYSAWKAARGIHWASALDRALTLSLSNVPSLPGRTLVLVDLSSSMHSPVGGKHAKLMRLETAAVFGSALALRAEAADLVAFSSESKVVRFSRADALVRLTDEVSNAVAHVGTDTWGAVRRHLTPQHSRIVILTDEQADSGYMAVDSLIGKRPMYTFNLGGYRVGHAPSGAAGRYVFGGLTDRAFTGLAALESHTNEGWPF